MRRWKPSTSPSAQHRSRAANSVRRERRQAEEVVAAVHHHVDGEVVAGEHEEVGPHARRAAAGGPTRAGARATSAWRRCTAGCRARRGRCRGPRCARRGGTPGDSSKPMKRSARGGDPLVGGRRRRRVAVGREQHRRAAERLHRLDVGLVEGAGHEVDAERPSCGSAPRPAARPSSRCTNPVSMFTAGVEPGLGRAGDVRLEARPSRPRSSERCGSRIADIPTIDRPGRSRSSGRSRCDSTQSA